MLSRFVSLVAFFLFAGTISAQTIPLDTAVHTGILDNGFTYYIRHNEEPKNRVDLYLVNKVGSVLEDPDQQGLAHFMEHMNFNGTTHFPKNELVSYLQKSGVRFGADLNAYTSFDETVYQLPLPTDDPAVLQNGFQIMRDWAQNATLDSVEIQKERGVVLEEERLGRGAGERMQRVYFPVLLNQSRYAERLPIGKVDILNQFPPAAIRRFYNDWYRPDLQALIVVGDIDPVKTEAMVKKMFSDLSTPANEKIRTKYTVPLSGRNQFLIVTDKEMQLTELQVLIKHRQEKLITEPDYIRAMQRQLFNQMIAERFSALAQTPNLPFIEAEAGITGFLGNLDVFSFDMNLKPGKYAEGFKLAWATIENIKRFGFNASELERAKQAYVSGEENALRELNKTNSDEYVGEYQRLFLNQEASPGIAWEFQFVKDHIAAITLEEINALVREYIRDQDRDILILAADKDKASLPDSATVTGWIMDIGKQPMTAYTDAVSLQPLIGETIVPGKIITTITNPKIGTTEWKLNNGIRIVLKPTDFKNDEIRFLAISPGGTSLYSDADYENASDAALIGAFGLGNFDPATLEKMLSGKILQVDPFIAERREGVEGYSTPKDLETALQIIWLRFTAPRKDSAIFNNMISSSREVIATRYNDPKNVFADTTNYILGSYNYRRSPPSIEKLNQLNLEKMYNIYKERFSDAAGFTFFFTGNFKIDSIRPLLEKYLGSLPALNKNEKPRDLGIHIPAGRITKKVFRGSENKATVKMIFSGNYVFTPENNMALQAIKEVLSIKITQHLREDESQVYSPNVQVASHKYPTARYAFTVSFGCAPANVDHLITDVEKEIASLRKNGPSLEDINKFKAEYRRLNEIQLRQNETWLDYLSTQFENNEDPNQWLEFNNRLNKITPADVQKAAGQWLSGNNEIRFVLLPENAPVK